MNGVQKLVTKYGSWYPASCPELVHGAIIPATMNSTKSPKI